MIRSEEYEYLAMLGVFSVIVVPAVVLIAILAAPFALLGWLLRRPIERFSGGGEP